MSSLVCANSDISNLILVIGLKGLGYISKILYLFGILSNSTANKLSLG